MVVRERRDSRWGGSADSRQGVFNASSLTVCILISGTRQREATSNEGDVARPPAQKRLSRVKRVEKFSIFTYKPQVRMKSRLIQEVGQRMDGEIFSREQVVL